MKNFALNKKDVYLIHASGVRYHEGFSSKLKEMGAEGKENIKVFDYLYDMPMYMAAADAVICRAGAMTLAELAMIGKPAILIPSPNVTDNHQYKNAKVIADKGGAYLIEEGENAEGEILKAVEELYSDGKVRESMSSSMRSFARPDAGKSIYREITKLISEKKK